MKLWHCVNGRPRINSIALTVRLMGRNASYAESLIARITRAQQMVK